MYNKIVQCCLAAGLMMASGFALADDSYVQQAQAAIAKATAPVTVWDGPTQGPALQPNKKIIFIASDMKNGGVLGVKRGLKKRQKSRAGNSTCWTVRVR